MVSSEEAVEQFIQQLLALDRRALRDTFQQSEKPPLTLVETLIVPALEHIGERWEVGELSLSQIYMSGRICEELVNTILPTDAPDRKRQPKIALVVLEDYHLLGKRIVNSVLRASGFEILDYGRMTVDDLIEQTIADSVEILMISTLMLASALKVKEVTKRCPAHIKIIVGGAPFRLDPTLWQDVGADAMGYNASDAVAIIEQLVHADTTATAAMPGGKS